MIPVTEDGKPPVQLAQSPQKDRSTSLPTSGTNVEPQNAVDTAAVSEKLKLPPQTPNPDDVCQRCSSSALVPVRDCPLLTPTSYLFPLMPIRLQNLPSILIHMTANEEDRDHTQA
ncbi:hypothetical protein YC2023_089839 [Brassica napus]